MKPSLPKIPKESKLNLFLDVMRITEAPDSYAYAAGISLIGCVLKRSYFVNQINWSVYPNTSVILIGPSGIGKDTTIKQVEKLIKELKQGPKLVRGRTWEVIIKTASEFPPKHYIYLPIKELTSVMGKKDYQQGLMEGITDILSDHDDKYDLSVKSDKKPVTFYDPTFTVHLGSTKEWLQTNTPEGALKGGFFPRFVVVVEGYTTKSRPIIRFSVTPEEKKQAEEGFSKLLQWLQELINKRLGKKSEEVRILLEANELYEEWYVNKEKYFPPSVLPYAIRSRDMVLRIAMIMAISLERDYITPDDMEFAIDLVAYLAVNIDKAMVPETIEAQIAIQIMKMLPCAHSQIMRELVDQYQRRKILDALENLRDAGRIVGDKREWRINDA